MRWLAITFQSIFALLLFMFVAIVAFVHFATTFGASATGASLEKIRQSPNYNGTGFENLVETTLSTSDPENPTPLSAYFFPAESKNPGSALPSKKLQSEQLTDGKFVWLGHSTVLFNVSSTIVLVDPVFHRASPIPVFGKPFTYANPTELSDLPAIDVVLLSHDHYDHADHLSIIELGGTVGHFIVPLGLAAHLQRWGVPPEKITELDWYDSHTVGGVKYVLTPSRHFSGRGISNRMSTLWGSWVVKSTDTSVWFSGDSGYFSEIKKIGELYGPFDIAFIENGAYSNDWKEVHMMPEQAVQATIDIQAKSFFPIHWGKFDLALHPWDEPVKRASNAASSLNVEMLTPVIGQVFAADERDFEPWWLIVQ